MDPRDYDDKDASQRSIFGEPLGESMVRDTMMTDSYDSPYPSSNSSSGYSNSGSQQENSAYSGSGDYGYGSASTKDDPFAASPFSSTSSTSTFGSSSDPSSSSSSFYGSSTDDYSAPSPFAASSPFASPTHSSSSASECREPYGASSSSSLDAFGSTSSSHSSSMYSQNADTYEAPQAAMPSSKDYFGQGGASLFEAEEASDTPAASTMFSPFASSASVTEPAFVAPSLDVNPFEDPAEEYNSGLEGIYMPASWAKQAAEISSLMLSSKVIVVTSAKGVGRTCFAHVLQQDPRMGQEALLISGQHCVDKQSLTQELANQLGLGNRVDEKSELFKVLGLAFQHQIIGNEELNPIIVDDAHLLPEACLEVLAQLVCTGDSPSPFRLIFLSDGPFLTRLKKHRLIQSVAPIQSLNLESWTPEECAGFLHFYQKIVGQQLLDEQQSNRLVRKSRGVVKKIMETLNPPQSEPVEEEKVFMSKKQMMSLGGVAALVMVVGVGSFYLLGSSDDIVTAAEDIRAELASKDRYANETQDPEARTSSSIAAQDSMLSSERDTRSFEGRDLSIPPSMIAEEVALEVAPSEPAAPVPAQTPSASIVPTTPQEAAQIETELKLAVQATTPKTNQVEAEALFAAVAKAPMAPTPKLSKGQFTVQLLAAQNRQNVDAFIKKHRLSGHVEVIDKSSPGKPTFVVVYGGYNNRDKAKEALAKLPPALLQLKPWVRTVDSLKSPA